MRHSLNFRKTSIYLLKRYALFYYLKGLANDNIFWHEWFDLPFIGRYRKIKEFVKIWNENSNHNKN